MQNIHRQFAIVTGLLLVFGLLMASDAGVVVTFNKLAGLTGGSPVSTAIYRADLSPVGCSELQSISITDNSFGLGGAEGQFSGFDLDAVILSNTLVSTASGAAALGGLPVFDYSPAGTLFAPGGQRARLAPKLFGSDATRTKVDNSVATLGVFDANSTIVILGFFRERDRWVCCKAM